MIVGANFIGVTTKIECRMGGVCAVVEVVVLPEKSDVINKLSIHPSMVPISATK